MLVLARRLNESIMIGDDIELVVIEIKGDQVKLGIKAPRSVVVHRKEVYEEIRKENEAALQSRVDDSKLKNIAGFLKKDRKKGEDQ